MSQIGILITSRNNYRLFKEFWGLRINNGDYPVLNIDEDSCEKEQNLGRVVCDEYGFVYLDREKRGMHHNLLTAVNYFESMGITHIIWFQSDCWPAQDDFFDQYNNLVKRGVLDQFGVIGFNGLAQNILQQDPYDKMVEQVKKGEYPIGVVGRCPLSNKSPWYCGIKSRRIKHSLKDIDKFHKPFAVESVAWFAAAIPIKQFRKHIDVSHKFYFHKSWDDIAYQFLVKNIYNITLPHLYVHHRPDLKPESGLPERSVRLAYKGKDIYHSLVGFKPDEWKKQWGFEFDNRKSFSKIRKKYKGTLLYKFYKHDSIELGPLKIFDI